ncbi:MAG: ATP-binding protein [Actinomycetes bacterium]
MISEGRVLPTRTIPESEWRAAIDRAGVPKVLQIAADQRQGAMAKIAPFLADLGGRIDRGEGLHLRGPSGVGKSVAAAQAMERAIRASRRGIWLRAYRLLTDAKLAAPNDPFSHLDSLVKAAQVVVIDDLGTEKRDSWVEEAVMSITADLYDSKRCLILTSNITDDQLAERYGDRTLDRIRAMCWRVTVAGQSLRRSRADKTRDADAAEEASHATTISDAVP